MAKVRGAHSFFVHIIRPLLEVRMNLCANHVAFPSHPALPLSRPPVNDGSRKNFCWRDAKTECLLRC